MKKFLLLLALLFPLLFPLLASAQLSVPIATTSRVGTVKPDGSTITVAADGTITAIGGGTGGPTNGLTPLQTTNAINSIATNNYIQKFNGSGTNSTLGTLTVLQGGYKNFYFANGSFLRTNTLAPFDWELHWTNGVTTFGTNNSTNYILDAKNGSLTLSNTLTTPLVGASGVDVDNLLVGTLSQSSLMASDSHRVAISVPNWTGAFTNDGNGNFGGVLLLDASALKASQFTKTGATTNLLSTMDGYAWTNLNIFDAPTNAFSGTAFILGTNSYFSTASDVHLISIVNPPAFGTERYGQLTIVATADLLVTNPVTWRASDKLISRTLTNGNSMCLALDVQVGGFTNFFVVQCK